MEHHHIHEHSELERHCSESTEQHLDTFAPLISINCMPTLPAIGEQKDFIVGRKLDTHALPVEPANDSVKPQPGLKMFNVQKIDVTEVPFVKTEAQTEPHSHDVSDFAKKSSQRGKKTQVKPKKCGVT